MTLSREEDWMRSEWVEPYRRQATRKADCCITHRLISTRRHARRCAAACRLEGVPVGPAVLELFAGGRR